MKEIDKGSDDDGNEEQPAKKRKRPFGAAKKGRVSRLIQTHGLV